MLSDHSPEFLGKTTWKNPPPVPPAWALMNESSRCPCVKDLDSQSLLCSDQTHPNGTLLVKTSWRKVTPLLHIGLMKYILMFCQIISWSRWSCVFSFVSSQSKFTNWPKVPRPPLILVASDLGTFLVRWGEAEPGAGGAQTGRSTHFLATGHHHHHHQRWAGHVFPLPDHQIYARIYCHRKSTFIFLQIYSIFDDAKKSRQCFASAIRFYLCHHYDPVDMILTCRAVWDNWVHQKSPRKWGKRSRTCQW